MRTLPLVKNPSRQILHGGSINLKNFSNPILDTRIVSAADGSASSVYGQELPIAHECMLAWCVKTLRSTYSRGTYEERVEETTLNTTKTPFPWSTIRRPELQLTDTDYAGNISIYYSNMSRASSGYGVSNITMIDSVLLFDEIFPSLFTVADATAKPFLKIKTSYVDKVMFREVHLNPWLAPNNITHHMERIAIAIINVVRSQSGSNEFVAGQALAPETYVEVCWAWLAFPLAMLALCTILLVATMIKMSKDRHEDVGVWKTSAMPALIYSLPQDMRHNLVAPLSSFDSSSGGAKKVKIRRMPTKSWRVSGHMSAPASPTFIRRSNPQAPPGWV
jgi:hypothetical protein